jgi:hypothetical protein
MLIFAKFALIFFCFLQGFIAGKQAQRTGTFSIWWLIFGMILGMTGVCL